MKFITSFLALLAINGALAQQGTIGTTNGGDGQWSPANYSVDATLENHTLFAPTTIPTGLKLPVLIWGEGGCIANGISFLALLTQVASHGVFVIASGAPGGTGTTTSKLMTDAIDWITAGAGKKNYPAVDSSRIAVAGMSCGGLEVYEIINDTRVSTFGIFNSGELDDASSKMVASKIAKPIFYFLGGSTDIAYENGERDWKYLPTTTPTWKGNQNVGHLATYAQFNAGSFGIAATRFFEWTLRGNTTSAEFFTGTGATNAGWSVESRGLELLKVTPI